LLSGALEQAGIDFSKDEQQITVRDAYRQVINLALVREPSFIMLVDFDRVLHWVSRFPDELSNMTDRDFNGFVSFARTRRAFESHADTQKLTEAIINKVASTVVGKEIDIMSGGFGLQADLAKEVVDGLTREDSGFYGEFLTVAVKNKFPITAVEVEGLEWEMPDQYQARIKEVGYDNWIKEFQSPEQWNYRLEMAKNCLEVLFELQKSSST